MVIDWLMVVMNKLEVGMYVRTIWGINKINEYVPQSGQLYLKTDVCVKSNVLKASHNIIDLIEVGDYVNGYEIIEKPYCYHDKYFVSINSRESWGWGIGEMPLTEIKSIVTKEQFESMKYSLEG